MTALELLRLDRESLFDCFPDIRNGHKPIPGTGEADAMKMVAEYDAAIAEVEGMVEALECAEEWLDGWASAEPYIGYIRAALAKARP